eukprot:CAMPEP_0196824558 /NCGR_PEP_ID=MMETSP1362-20130617/92317_1 /TAXON_ID=163516 /ORGANISM="Leptocylindrus danicus, Strain CCMP1856" /LENGTH=381 /DNA_ID=CAMNT_0042204857 /DNA_START=93 /DNA_END=1238 /DNA_ORIENTATION=+
MLPFQFLRNVSRSPTAATRTTRILGGTCLASLLACEAHSSNSGADRAAKCSPSPGHDDRVKSKTELEIEPEKLIDFAREELAHETIIPAEYVKVDTYNGVFFANEESPIDELKIKQFAEAFELSLEQWKVEKRRGVWITVNTQLACLVPLITELGFDFQFAEKGKLVLTRWLPDDSESRLPLGPTHQVGIGALVLHPVTGKMLVVQEKTGPAAARKLWKMPTGLTDPGEDIAEAAVRELKEETGLDCVFDHIICFRQAHGGLFNKSDMFFVCLCRLGPSYDKVIQDGGEIEMIPQEAEIADAKWVEMTDYFNQDLWLASPLYRKMNEAMLNAATHHHQPDNNQSKVTENGDSSKDSTKLVGQKLDVGFRPGQNTLYVNSKL